MALSVLSWLSKQEIISNTISQSTTQQQFQTLTSSKEGWSRIKTEHSNSWSLELTYTYIIHLSFESNHLNEYHFISFYFLVFYYLHTILFHSSLSGILLALMRVFWLWLHFRKKTLTEKADDYSMPEVSIVKKTIQQLHNKCNNVK